MASKENVRSRGECCMCGDQGLLQELFQCRICNFRSQHRYCSDLYPKAESYEVCNWCLKKKEQEEITQTSSSSISSSSSHDHNSGNNNNNNNNNNIIDEEPNYKEKKNRRNNINGNYSDVGHAHFNLKAHRQKGTTTTTTTSHHHRLNLSKPIKKQRSPDRSFGKKKNIAFSCNEVGKEGNLRIPKFEEIPQNRMPKKVFRSRIPRYKLLEEVCR